LLRAFPEDVPLHLRRYDALEEDKRYAEASAALQPVQTISANNAYLLAGIVKSECRQKRFAEAQEHGLIVCFARLEQSDWPADQVWKQISGNELAEDFAAEFHARLLAGEPPTPHSLARYVKHLLTGNEYSSMPKWLRQSRLNAVTRKVTNLLRLVEQASWSDVTYLAELMTLLNKHSYRKLVIASWKRVSKRVSRQGLERNTAMRAQVGNAIINQGEMAEANGLLADWRERPGVQMWMVCNYLVTLPRLGRAALSALIASSEDAMAGLQHDHSARYLVY
jgi:hypothetical protein